MRESDRDSAGRRPRGAVPPLFDFPCPKAQHGATHPDEKGFNHVLLALLDSGRERVYEPLRPAGEPRQEGVVVSAAGGVPTHITVISSERRSR